MFTRQSSPNISLVFVVYNNSESVACRKSCQGTFFFLSILLLAEGRTAYMGSTADAIQYFEK